MPELPEVETLARALRSSVIDRRISAFKFHRKSLRDPIPVKLVEQVSLNKQIRAVERRSKYLVILTNSGHLLVHLGMSGSMLLFPSATPRYPHTHFVIKLAKVGEPDVFVHYIDPRRFGRLSAGIGEAWLNHPFFEKLGPEPLQTPNLGGYLAKRGTSSKRSVKSFLMDASIVVGVGNIYACESLFLAKINPLTLCCELSKAQFATIARKVQSTLKKAITQGGTSIKDFKNLEGKPGYFSQALNVYGRTNEQCRKCSNKIIHIRQNGRSTWYCKSCQK